MEIDSLFEKLRANGHTVTGRVRFIIDDWGIDSYECSHCGGKFALDLASKGRQGVGWLSKDNMLCCSPKCAELKALGDELTVLFHG